MKITPKTQKSRSQLRPITAYSLHELRRLYRVAEPLCASLPTIGADVQLLQLRFQQMPAHANSVQHSHSYYEAILVLDGAVTYPTFTPPLLHAGDLCLHHPATRHSWQTGDCPCLYLACWFTTTKPLLPVPLFPVSVSCPDLLDDVQLLAHEILSTPPGWQKRVPLRIATMLARVTTLDEPRTVVEMSPLYFERLLSLIDTYVRDNLQERLSLSSIAAHLGMSERSLVREYHLRTGRTLWSSVQRIRLEESALLLLESDMSVSEVGVKVGMSDPAYFCARFRQFHGVTPRQYRRNGQRTISTS